MTTRTLPMRTLLRTALAAALVLGMSGPGNAYWATWVPMGKKVGVVKCTLKVAGEGKFKITLDGKSEPESYSLDATAKNRYVLRWKHVQTDLLLAGSLEEKSDHKAIIIAGLDDEGVMSLFLAHLFGFDSAKKVKRIDPVEVDVTEVKPKGKLSVNKKLTKARFRLRSKVTGTVKSGEHVGKAVKGTIQIKFNGGR